jgi:hypothetical protein
MIPNVLCNIAQYDIKAHELQMNGRNVADFVIRLRASDKKKLSKNNNILVYI